MKCNPRYTKLLVNYPYKFCDINHNHIRNYFNSFQIFFGNINILLFYNE